MLPVLSNLALICYATATGLALAFLVQREEIVHRLASKADVVMENFRPGIMDRMGIGYEALSGVNPRLIYCAVSGFGQTGPERTTAAYDGKIQAMSGIMSVTGQPDGPPVPNSCNLREAVSGLRFLMYRFAPVFASALGGLFVFSASAQNLTVQVGTPPASPTPLVNHGDSWRYHKGTNAPVVGWQTSLDASLGVQWPTGNGVTT